MLARKMKIERVILKINSLATLMNYDNVVLRSIKRLVVCDWEIEFKYVFREGDRMRTTAFNLASGICVFSQLPDAIFRILHKDLNDFLVSTKMAYLHLSKKKIYE